MSAPRTAKANIKRAQIEREAVELRLAGLTYSRIAERLGVGAATACRAVKASMQRLADECREPAIQIRQQELERLDRMWSRHYPLALGVGDAPPDQKAAELCLKIMRRRAEMLGLDAPKEERVQLEGTVDVQIRLVKPSDDVEMRQSSNGSYEAHQEPEKRLNGGSGGQGGDE